MTPENCLSNSFHIQREQKDMCNLADRKSKLPPIDQPLQNQNFCRLDGIIVFDV